MEAPKQSPSHIGFMKHVQGVLDTYHLSFLQIAILVFLVISILTVYFFQDQVKDILRVFVRRMIYESQMSSDGKTVETTNRTGASSLNQLLTYLEQTWLSSPNSRKESLPANVELSERYNLAIPGRSDVEPNVHLVDVLESLP